MFKETIKNVTIKFKIEVVVQSLVSFYQFPKIEITQ